MTETGPEAYNGQGPLGLQRWRLGDDWCSSHWSVEAASRIFARVALAMVICLEFTQCLDRLSEDADEEVVESYGQSSQIDT